MAKLFSLLFSTLILFQSFNLNLEDYSKISALIEHAQFHNEIYGDSFIEFISEHYNTSYVTAKKQHKEHDNLPFKQDSNNCQHPSNNFTFNLFTFSIENKSYIEIPLNFYYSKLYSFIEKSSVFQPPKLV